MKTSFLAVWETVIALNGVTQRHPSNMIRIMQILCDMISGSGALAFFDPEWIISNVLAKQQLMGCVFEEIMYQMGARCSVSYTTQLFNSAGCGNQTPAHVLHVMQCEPVWLLLYSLHYLMSSNSSANTLISMVIHMKG